MGGLGNDILIGNGGNDLISGGGGNDVIFADGFESVDTSAGRASPRRATQTKLYFFRARRRRNTGLIVGGRGSDNIHGGAQQSVILVRRGDASPQQPEQILGGMGRDMVWGNGVSIPSQFPVLVKSPLVGSSLPLPVTPEATHLSQTPEDPSFQSETKVITDPLTGGVFMIEGISNFQQTSILAQIGNGAGLVSDLVYTNPSASQAVTVDVSFSGDEGQDLELQFKGRGTAAEFEFKIPALGSRTLISTGEGDLVAGAAQTTSTGPVGSTVRFALENLGVTGVPESLLLDSFLIPVTRDVSSGLSTGFAVFNFGGQDSLRVTLNNLDGRMADSTTVAIAADGHLSVFVHELFEIEDFVGTMRVDGSPLAATVIQLGSDAGQFTTCSARAEASTLRFFC